MYVPKDFVLDDPRRIAEVIRTHSFAALITALDGEPPQATHLPFLYDPARGPKGTLLAHMARANGHWRDLARLAGAGGEALVVFQGPHAYVSPRWYETGPAVPTWNYVAVHAYGTPRLLDDPAGVRALLERLVATHEAGAAAPWSLDGQDPGYLARMMRAIVAFEVPVARLEAKAKLSQNRPPEDRRRVVSSLFAGGEPLATEVAVWMEALASEA